MPEAVFLPAPGDRGESGERLVATELSRGPWDPGAQHGGAPAALLMRAFECVKAPRDLVIARVTYEFLHPVPLGELDVRVEVIRPGHRVQLCEASILTPDGLEVVRARALCVRPAGTGVARARLEPPPAGPEAGAESDWRPPHRPLFAPDAVELRFVAGAFHDGGPATAWFRLRHPLVAGEEPSALQRLAAAGDFGNGISATVPWERYMFINPDLTLYLEREPASEWICLAATTRIAPGGIGISESVLYDQHGRVGRATQALLVARR